MGAASVLLAMTAAFLALMVAVSAWVAQRLPDDGPVPVHFDVRGNADRFGSRWVVLGMLPVLYVLFTGLLVGIGTNLPSGEADDAELLFGHGIASVVMLGAHGLIAFLVMRWVRQR